jgi:hypothetical protein
MTVRMMSKAIAGGLTAGAAALTAAAVDGGIAGTEWWTILAAAIGGFAVVFAAPANGVAE